jgi:membrane protease YdiL (CAAX protease family)
LSIAVAPELSRTDVAVWLIAAAVSLVLAAFTDVVRWPRRSPTDEARNVPLLGATAVATLVFWLAAQTVLVSLVRVEAVTGGPGVLSDARLTALAVATPAAGIAAAVWLLRRWRLFDQVGLSPANGRQAVAWGGIGIVIALPVVILTSALVQVLWEAINYTHPDQHQLLRAYDHAYRPWMRPAIWLAAVGLAPVFEEILFRGLFQSTFTSVTRRPWAGIVAASLLFALIHPFWTAPAIFVLSVFLGIVYHRSGNLWAAIVMHALFNAFGLATTLSR